MWKAQLKHFWFNCQRGNQKPKIEQGQTTQWPKEKRTQQWATSHHTGYQSPNNTTTKNRRRSDSAPAIRKMSDLYKARERHISDLIGKTTKGQPETENLRRTDNTMTKRKGTKQWATTHQTENQSPNNRGWTPQGKGDPYPLVAPYKAITKYLVLRTCATCLEH
jgi:hypothetical protein